MDEYTKGLMSAKIVELQQQYNLSKVPMFGPSPAVRELQLQKLPAAFGHNSVTQVQVNIKQRSKSKGSAAAAEEWLRSGFVLPILADFKRKYVDAGRVEEKLIWRLGASDRIDSAANNLSRMAAGSTSETLREKNDDLIPLAPYVRQLAAKSRGVLAQRFRVESPSGHAFVCATALLIAIKDLRANPDGFFGMLLRSPLAQPLRLCLRRLWQKKYKLPRGAPPGDGDDIDNLVESSCTPLALFGLGPWTVEERLSLFHAVQLSGDEVTNWVEVAAELACRSVGECKRQWYFELESASMEAFEAAYLPKASRAPDVRLPLQHHDPATLEDSGSDISTVLTGSAAKAWTSGNQAGKNELFPQMQDLQAKLDQAKHTLESKNLEIKQKNQQIGAAEDRIKHQWTQLQKLKETMKKAAISLSKALE